MSYLSCSSECKIFMTMFVIFNILTFTLKKKYFQHNILTLVKKFKYVNMNKYNIFINKNMSLGKFSCSSMEAYLRLRIKMYAKIN